MSETYKDFAREPSKPHQCMHSSEKDGARCRAIAMHNQYMCYHHRSDDIPTVIENDPFLIEGLNDHDAIQKALADVASRLACNRMDFKRAALLLQNLQVASSNLAAKSRHLAANSLLLATKSLLLAAPPSVPVILSEAKNPRIDTTQKTEGPASHPTTVIPSTTPKPVILSEARSAQPKDPETSPSTSTASTLQPQISSTNQQPATPVILSEAHSAQPKDPETSGSTPTASTLQPQISSTNHQPATPVILSEAHSAQPKDPETSGSTPTASTLQPQISSTDHQPTREPASLPTSVILSEAKNPRISPLPICPTTIPTNSLERATCTRKPGRRPRHGAERALSAHLRVDNVVS